MFYLILELKQQQQATSTLTDTKFHVPAVNLSTEDNTKLLIQLIFGFKSTINRNKYQLKVEIQAQNPYSDYLIEPSFQAVNKIFALSFENNTDGTVRTKYYLSCVKLKDYNVTIDGQSFCDKSVKIYLKTYDNIRKIRTNYFNKCYKMIAIDLGKQQALDSDPKVIQQINFIGHLARE